MRRPRNPAGSALSVPAPIDVPSHLADGDAVAVPYSLRQPVQLHRGSARVIRDTDDDLGAGPAGGGAGSAASSVPLTPKAPGNLQARSGWRSGTPSAGEPPRVRCLRVDRADAAEHRNIGAAERRDVVDVAAEVGEAEWFAAVRQALAAGHEGAAVRRRCHAISPKSSPITATPPPGRICRAIKRRRAPGTPAGREQRGPPPSRRWRQRAGRRGRCRRSAARSRPQRSSRGCVIGDQWSRAVARLVERDRSHGER